MQTVNHTLTLDFDNSDQFESHHYAFHVSDEDFDAIFDRVKAEDIPYGSGPFDPENMQINVSRGTRLLFQASQRASSGAADPHLERRMYSQPAFKRAAINFTRIAS